MHLAGSEDAGAELTIVLYLSLTPESLLDYSWHRSYATCRLFLFQNSSLAASPFVSAVHRDPSSVHGYLIMRGCDLLL